MFDCAACKAKDKEIEYLRTLVDRALVKNGMAPVLGEKPQGSEQLELNIPDTIDSASEIISYGDRQ
jgi:hypothetical protein